MSDEYVVEQFEHAGLTVKIRGEQYIDESFSPRDYDGILGIMFTAHRGYNFGGASHGLDINNDLPEFEIQCPVCEGSGESETRFELLHARAYGREIVGAGSYESMRSEADRLNDKAVNGSLYMVTPADCPKCKGEGAREVSPEEYVRHYYGARVVLKLGLIDHSGISMYVGGGAHPMDSGGWDSGTVGIYFDSAETREQCGVEDWSDEKIRDNLVEEIEIYDAYLRGEVYFYTVEDEDGDVLDSCGGFLGSTLEKSGILEEARYAAQSAREALDEEARESAHWAARDVETI